MFKVESFIFRVVGILSLAISSFAQGTDDFGNTPSTATALPLTAVVSGRIESPADIDYFRISVSTTTKIRVAIRIPGTTTLPSSPSISATLLDNDLGEIGATSDIAAFNYKRPIYPFLSLGTYYIKVAGAQVSYQLSIEQIADDHGDTVATATPVSLNTVARGKIDYAGESDAFGIQPADGDIDVFRVFVTSQGELYPGVAGANYDVYSSLGNRLTLYYYFDNFGDNFAEVNAGIYYISVGRGSRVGSYQLAPRHVSKGVPPNDDAGSTPFDAIPIPLNSDKFGLINFSGDIDVFVIEPTEAGRLRIDLTGGALRILDASYRPVQSVTQFNPPTGGSATFASIAGGRYFLEISTPPVVGGYKIHPAFMADSLARDDHANVRAQATSLSPSGSVDGKIDYAGDFDVFQLNIQTDSTLTLRSEGSADLIGWLTTSQGATVASNDNAEISSKAFGFTQFLRAGTYYLHVAHSSPESIASYTIKSSLFGASHNYTDLWWNPGESGWGMNVNHQGDTLFATLFVYDADGQGMWLVMSNGQKESSGIYSGTLYRTTGPAFNASPWTPITVSPVGTMRLAFADRDRGQLTYSVGSLQVTKQVSRQTFATPPACSFSAFDRSYATNYQDLWWNPDESGWGINITHQRDTIFATLFTYDLMGKNLWLVMTNGPKQVSGEYTGDLYRTKGTAFSSNIWTPITTTKSGTMSLRFIDGKSGILSYTVDGVTVTKNIFRQVFGTPASECR